MAHRLIGQERFGFAGGTRSASTLDALGQLIDWASVGALLDPLYAGRKGEPAWPPLAMFKALLLSIWHDLSDVKLAEGHYQSNGAAISQIGYRQIPLCTRLHWRLIQSCFVPRLLASFLALLVVTESERTKFRLV